MKTLTISVTGELNSGKSTVAEAIRCALTAHGFNVEIYDRDRAIMGDGLLYEWLDKQERRLSALKDKVEVKVITVQTKRV